MKGDVWESWEEKNVFCTEEESNFYSLTFECGIDLVNQVWQKLWYIMSCMRLNYEKIAASCGMDFLIFRSLVLEEARSHVISSFRQPI